MSPDIQWHVDDGTEQKTIASASSLRRSRRSWIAVLIVVVLGAGLGMAYRSIPEPAPRPTPMPSPTPRPTPTHPAVPTLLFAAIDGEAQALADGDVETVIAWRIPGNEANWAEQQRQSLVAWGRPRDDSPLYTIVDFNLRTQTKAWADVRQFRDGRWFRETRFYDWKKDRWRRNTYVDDFFWGAQEEKLETPHLKITYAVEDRDLVAPVAEHLEEHYQALCSNLDCASLVTQSIKLPITLRANEGPMIAESAYWVPADGDKDELRLPSPRVTGVFEGEPLFLPENDKDIWPFAQLLAERIAHGKQVEYDHSGDQLLYGITDWAVLRQAVPRPADRAAIIVEWKPGQLLPLGKLWETLSEEDHQ